MQRRASRRAAVLALASVSLAYVSTVLADEADQWVPRAPILVARQEGGVAALGGKIYVIGGIDADRNATGITSRYDIATNAWEPLPPLPDGTALHHIGAAAVGGKVYSIGGRVSGSDPVRAVFAFDPTLDQWDSVADLPTGRSATGVAVLDGRIYVAGGRGTESPSVTDFAVYIPAENRWDPLPPMMVARNHHAAAGHGGLVYVVGGRDRIDGSTVLYGTLEVYDPQTRSWDVRDPMTTPRAGIAAAVVGDEIFVFGGEGNSMDPNGIFPQTESYSIALDCWFSRLEMDAPRHGIGAATATLNSAPAIFIPAGSGVQGFGVTDVHQAFVPGTPPWAGGLPFLRSDSNRDGSVDVADAVFTLLVLFGGSGPPPCEDAADADDNSSINVADVIFTLRYLFGSDPAPPAPGPDVEGTDLTPDKLGCER